MARNDINPAEFAEWYSDKTKTSSHIARRFGINPAAISYYVRRFNLQPRPAGTGFYSKEQNSERAKAAKKKKYYKPQDTIKAEGVAHCESCHHLAECIQITRGPVLCEVYLFLDENPAHQDYDPVVYYISPETAIVHYEAA